MRVHLADVVDTIALHEADDAGGCAAGCPDPWPCTVYAAHCAFVDGLLSKLDRIQLVRSVTSGTDTRRTALPDIAAGTVALFPPGVCAGRLGRAVRVRIGRVLHELDRACPDGAWIEGAEILEDRQQWGQFFICPRSALVAAVQGTSTGVPVQRQPMETP